MLKINRLPQGTGSTMIEMPSEKNGNGKEEETQDE